MSLSSTSRSLTYVAREASRPTTSLHRQGVSLSHQGIPKLPVCSLAKRDTARIDIQTYFAPQKPHELCCAMLSHERGMVSSSSPLVNAVRDRLQSLCHRLSRGLGSQVSQACPHARAKVYAEGIGSVAFFPSWQAPFA